MEKEAMEKDDTGDCEICKIAVEESVMGFCGSVTVDDKLVGGAVKDDTKESQISRIGVEESEMELYGSVAVDDKQFGGAMTDDTKESQISKIGVEESEMRVCGSVVGDDKLVGGIGCRELEIGEENNEQINCESAKTGKKRGRKPKKAMENNCESEKKLAMGDSCENENKPKKRGRKPKKAMEDTCEAEKKPKKRGRKPKKATEENFETEKRPKKRGRKPKKAMEDDCEAQTRPKKRGRKPKKAMIDKCEAEKRPKKRGRKPKKPMEKSEKEGPGDGFLPEKGNKEAMAAENQQRKEELEVGTESELHVENNTDTWKEQANEASPRKRRRTNGKEVSHAKNSDKGEEFWNFMSVNGGFCF